MANGPKCTEAIYTPHLIESLSLIKVIILYCSYQLTIALLIYAKVPLKITHTLDFYISRYYATHHYHKYNVLNMNKIHDTESI